MAEKADVVIIGAGLIGLSVAYHLAAKGVRNIMVLEKEASWGQGSSGRSAGGVRLQFGHPSNIKLSQYGLDMYLHFEELFGISASVDQCGYLFLTRDPTRWEKLLQIVAIQQSLGVPVETLSSQEVHYRFPYVQMDALVGATFCATDGTADPGAVAYGFARSCTALGVQIRNNEEATAILTNGGRVVAVKTSDGAISTPIVVNAAGPYARVVGRMIGLEIPVDPYRRQIYVTTPTDALPSRMPMTLEFETTSYLRREGASILFGMSDPDEPSSFNTNTDQSSLAKLVDALVQWVPAMSQASLMRGWAGLYEITPDDSPIIGTVPGIEGIYLANGFSGHGFMHAPGAGRALAELIIGQSPFVDLSPFAFERFTGRRQIEEPFII